MKFWKMNLSFIAILSSLMLLQACGRQLEVQESCGFVQNSQMQRVSWKGASHFNLYIDESVPTHYHESIRFAAERWNQSIGRDFIKVHLADGKGSSAPTKDGYSKIYFLNTWEQERLMSEQARTTIYWTGSRIYEADIRVNTIGFSYFTNGEQSGDRLVHLESLLIHEIGHALGLAHTDEIDSVMKPNLPFSQLRDNLAAVDESFLSCEY